MTNPVIVRLEKYIPRSGGPVVFQVFEEVEVSPGRWIQLDPRNPTPGEVESADDKAIAQQQATIAALTAERDSLQSQLSAMTTERDAALSEKASLETQLDSANATIETLRARIEELENPPNPFPDADWKNFRFAILADPAINRVATENATAWPLMVQYLSQFDTMPSRGVDIAQLWNFLEAHTAVDAEEIARINAIAERFSIPLRINDEGQIQL